MSLAYIDTSGRGEVTASFSLLFINMSKLFKGIKKRPVSLKTIPSLRFAR
jgi:hypothetical protein